MDENMKLLQQSLIELETEAEHLTSGKPWFIFRLSVPRRQLHQLVENDKVRNGNREALTALRKMARTTKTSVPSPFESMMKDIGNPGSRPLVKEFCATCGNHDSNEWTWMMFPGTDVFAKIPFHAAHTILETEKGVLADKISPGVLRSLVALKDKPW
ncbi:Lactate/malate dehydrogenase family protein isoform 1 [Hibiscus syriacus]|uniref:Lactate/malate dehydrogenase family protein isoform 1 n=1 Tax=Hibiscus syriacus TaxID=106335 RepID=A0A6A3A1L6_HIBSY|nr:Lactate/malate dehydrogenase family protein isoform 1 [Hibiscus syriacus]